MIRHTCIAICLVFAFKHTLDVSFEEARVLHLGISRIGINIWLIRLKLMFQFNVTLRALICTYMLQGRADR